MTEEPHGQDCDEDSADERIEHLLTGIELQMLLIPGTNTGDTNDKNRGYFTPYQITVIIDEPPLDTVVDVTENTSPIVKKFRDALGLLAFLEVLHYLMRTTRL